MKDPTEVHITGSVIAAEFLESRCILKAVTQLDGFMTQ